MTALSAQLTDWLSTHANSLDQSEQHADELLIKLAEEGIFKHGLPKQYGGYGDSIHAAIQAISEVAQFSLTAAFISWGHRTLIENLVFSKNSAPRERWLADLLNGRLAGGTGLSNAVKFLSGVEELQVSVTKENGKMYLNGKLPWVTNIRADNFLTVFAASFADNSAPPLILVVPSDAKGVTRTANLSLIALQGSNTAAILFDHVELDADWILSDNAAQYLSEIRPAFLGLQCAMAFGLADRCLKEVSRFLGENRSVLRSEWTQTANQLTEIKKKLSQGLETEDYFVQHPKELFQLRIDIVDVVAASSLLELQASGGRCYLQNAGSDFVRRWRETAFLPVVTPSAVQLRLVLGH